MNYDYEPTLDTAAFLDRLTGLPDMAQALRDALNPESSLGYVYPIGDDGKRIPDAVFLVVDPPGDGIWVLPDDVAAECEKCWLDGARGEALDEYFSR